MDASSAATLTLSTSLGYMEDPTFADLGPVPTSRAFGSVGEDLLAYENEDLPHFKIIKVPKKELVDIVYSARKRTVTDAAICKAKQVPTDIYPTEVEAGSGNFVHTPNFRADAAFFQETVGTLDSASTDMPSLIFDQDTYVFGNDRRASDKCVKCDRNEPEYDSDMCSMCLSMSFNSDSSPPVQPETTVMPFYESTLDAPLLQDPVFDTSDLDFPSSVTYEAWDQSVVVASSEDMLESLQTLLINDHDSLPDPVIKKRRHTDALRPAPQPFTVFAPPMQEEPFPLSVSAPESQLVSNMAKLLEHVEEQIQKPIIPFAFTPPCSRRSHDSPRMSRQHMRVLKVKIQTRVK